MLSRTLLVAASLPRSPCLLPALPTFCCALLAIALLRSSRCRCFCCCCALLAACARCVFSLHGNWHSLNPISSTLALVAHGTLNALCCCCCCSDFTSAAAAAVAVRSFLCGGWSHKQFKCLQNNLYSTRQQQQQLQNTQNVARYAESEKQSAKANKQFALY